MLPLVDGGVVDRTAKVYNHSNTPPTSLSIPVVPLHIGAHLQSTAYALGEIAADMINYQREITFMMWPNGTEASISG
ncbi:hypothetical protein B0H15DRAFT_843577 [Mycena belliarum]|uniref:Uncharacterized protein n=1 Tax=Mycena belliarum TaxID=1033014 RepID=A0AAD6U7J0_9AGAR|nr:hypothetical protein B0H15DRAFT_843577 [Mycena belliae]